MDISVKVSRNSKEQILSVYLINFFLLSEVHINFEMKMVENSYSLDKNSKRGRANTLLNKMVVPAFMRPRSPARKRALSAISLSRSFGNFLYIFFCYHYIRTQLFLGVYLAYINKFAYVCGFTTLNKKFFVTAYSYGYST